MSHVLQCKLFSLSCDYWMIALALLHPPHTFLLLLLNRRHGLSSSSSSLPALSCILCLLREREMCTAVCTGKKWGWQRQRWSRSTSWVTDDTKLGKSPCVHFWEWCTTLLGPRGSQVPVLWFLQGREYYIFRIAHDKKVEGERFIYRGGSCSIRLEQNFWVKMRW